MERKSGRELLLEMETLQEQPPDARVTVSAIPNGQGSDLTGYCPVVVHPTEHERPDEETRNGDAELQAIFKAMTDALLTCHLE